MILTRTLKLEDMGISASKETLELYNSSLYNVFIFIYFISSLQQPCKISRTVIFYSQLSDDKALSA